MAKKAAKKTSDQKPPKAHICVGTDRFPVECDALPPVKSVVWIKHGEKNFFVSIIEHRWMFDVEAKVFRTNIIAKRLPKKVATSGSNGPIW